MSNFRSNFRSKTAVTVACVAFLSIGAAGCSKKSEITNGAVPVANSPAVNPPAVNPPAVNPPLVKTMTITDAGASADVKLAAEVRPRFETRLAFRVGGRITERKAEIGQSLTAGSVVARIDAADYALAAQASQSAIVAAQADATLANAELKRYQELADKGFFSAAALEQRRTSALAAGARLKQAQASGSVQTNQVGYANLTTPESGTVITVEADPGQVVAAGQTVVRIARGQATDVLIALPEQWLAGARAARFKVMIPAINKSFDAVVREVGAAADPATRTYPVKLSLPEDPQIKFGMSAQVLMSLPTVAGAMPTLPLSAIVEQAGKSIIYVVDEQTFTVSAKPVEVVGSAVGTDVQVRGLKAGDRIVAAGGHLLAAGQKIRLVQ